jgi:hypothetical protein
MQRLAPPKRATTALVLLVLGGALTVAIWVGGDHGYAVATGLFYAVCTTIVYVASGRSGDVAAIMRTDGDERQRSIDREATLSAGMAMGAVAILGTIVQSARGEDPGGFVIIAAVGGVTYMIAIAVLRRRR